MQILPKVVVSAQRDMGASGIQDDATGRGQFLSLRRGKRRETLSAHPPTPDEHRDKKGQPDAQTQGPPERSAPHWLYLLVRPSFDHFGPIPDCPERVGRVSTAQPVEL